MFVHGLLAMVTPRLLLVLAIEGQDKGTSLSSIIVWSSALTQNFIHCVVICTYKEAQSINMHYPYVLSFLFEF